MCGILNQNGKPCQRIGRCPFHSTKSDKKGIPKRGWAKDEHTKFLHGLRIHGRGRWKEIASIVGTKTPTQIQSHAQKYFLRQKQTNKNKRSIHDFSLEDLETSDGNSNSVTPKGDSPSENSFIAETPAKKQSPSNEAKSPTDEMTSSRKEVSQEEDEYMESEHHYEPRQPMTDRVFFPYTTRQPALHLSNLASLAARMHWEDSSVPSQPSQAQPVKHDSLAPILPSFYRRSSPVLPLPQQDRDHKYH